MEATTANSPYMSFHIHRDWEKVARDISETEFRLGFFRAPVSTSNPIYFGMSMMLITGLLFSMRGYAKSVMINPGAIIAALFGALVSFSSGPWIACVVLLVLNAFINRVDLIKPALFALLIVAIFLEVASNRHFYHLIDYLALNSHNAWYRTKLLEVAVSQWQEFWLFGVGGHTPNHWAAMIDGRKNIDLVNHHLILALYGGVPGLIMYIASHVIAIREAVRSWGLIRDQRYQKMIFGFAATLVALDIATMSVGLFGPALLLSYILLGFLISVTGAWYPRKRPFAVPHMAG
jgi:hypothetical protein